MKRFIRVISFVVVVMVLGGAGSLLLLRILIPLMAAQPQFSKARLLRELVSGVTILKPVERVVVEERESPARMLKSVVSSVGSVILVSSDARAFRPDQVQAGSSRIDDAQKAIVAQASGVFISSDGGFLTHAQAVLERGALEVRHGGNLFPAKVAGVDRKAGLALLKVEGTGFPAASFADAESLALGDELFFLWREQSTDMIAGSTEGLALAKIFVRQELFSGMRDVPLETFGDLPSPDARKDGASLFTREGKLSGIFVFDSEQKWRFISAKAVERFLAAQE